MIWGLQLQPAQLSHLLLHQKTNANAWSPVHFLINAPPTLHFTTGNSSTVLIVWIYLSLLFLKFLELQVLFPVVPDIEPTQTYDRTTFSLFVFDHFLSTQCLDGRTPVQLSYRPFGFRLFISWKMQVFEFFHIRLCQIESSQTCLVTSNLALEQVVCPFFFFWGGGG